MSPRTPLLLLLPGALAGDTIVGSPAVQVNAPAVTKGADVWLCAGTMLKAPDRLYRAHVPLEDGSSMRVADKGDLPMDATSDGWKRVQCGSAPLQRHGETGLIVPLAQSDGYHTRGAPAIVSVNASDLNATASRRRVKLRANPVGTIVVPKKGGDVLLVSTDDGFVSEFSLPALAPLRSLELPYPCTPGYRSLLRTLTLVGDDVFGVIGCNMQTTPMPGRLQAGLLVRIEPAGLQVAETLSIPGGALPLEPTLPLAVYGGRKSFYVGSSQDCPADMPYYSAWCPTLQGVSVNCTATASGGNGQKKTMRLAGSPLGLYTKDFFAQAATAVVTPTGLGPIDGVLLPGTQCPFVPIPPAASARANRTSTQDEVATHRRLQSHFPPEPNCTRVHLLAHASLATATDGAQRGEAVEAGNGTAFTEKNESAIDRVAALNSVGAVYALLTPLPNLGAGAGDLILAVAAGRAVSDAESLLKLRLSWQGHGLSVLERLPLPSVPIPP